MTVLDPQILEICSKTVAFLLCLEDELFFQKVTTSHILNRLTELQVGRLFVENVREPQSVARLPADLIQE